MNNRRDFLKQTISASAGIFLVKDNFVFGTNLVGDGDLGVLRLIEQARKYSIYETNLLKAGNYKRKDWVLAITLDDLRDCYTNFHFNNVERTFEYRHSITTNIYECVYKCLNVDKSLLSIRIKVPKYVTDVLNLNNLYLLPILTFKDKKTVISEVTISSTRNFGYYD